VTYDDTARPTSNISSSIRDWARRDKAVAKRLRRIDNRRMEYMRSLFAAFCPDEEEVESRCLLAFSLFIGNHSSPPITAPAAAPMCWRRP
jgi:hypothetical protein